jgi:uncharacterized protein
MTNATEQAQIFYDAALQGQFDRIPGLLHDDFEFHPMQGFPFGKVYQGWDAVVGEFFPQLLGVFASWAAVPATIFVADGDRVVVTGHYQAGIKGKTDKVEIPFLHLWEVRDEKLALCRSFTDTALVQQAVQAGSSSISA